MSVTVKNPHSILVALKKRPQDVQSVSLPGGNDAGEGWKEVADLARQNRIPAKRAEKEEFRSHSPHQKDGRVGGANAVIREKSAVSLEKLFENNSDEGYGVWLALDQVQDPQNVGAIFRMAAFFGVRGILMTQDRSAALGGTVYDVSCGGVECVPFAIEVNLQRALEAAKKADLWILGTSEHARDSFSKIQADRNWLVVVGNEESGIRKLTEKSCDQMCTVPTAPGAGVTSLNVSTATAVIISHLRTKI